MTDRVVAVLARPSPLLPAELAAAMLEDVVDLVSDTPMVAPALAVAAGYAVEAEALTWPGTLVVRVQAEPTIAEILAAVAQRAVSTTGERGELPELAAVAVVVPDVPDLPTLLLGKLFSALAGPRGSAVAVCPSDGSGLVAVAAGVPHPSWLADLRLGLDHPDGLSVLRAAAPRGELSVGPGWHRVRTAVDLDRLDPALEGWEATRTFLTKAM